MSERINRRDCLRLGASGVLAGAMVGFHTASSAADDDAAPTARIGFVGLGGRGQWLLDCLVTHFAHVQIPAVCDLISDRVGAGVEIVKRTGRPAPIGYCGGEHEYRNMLQRDDLDAVIVATGVQVMAGIACDVMKAEKHAAAEVTGAYSMEDCWAIVEAKEQSGKHYMLLEQCCYDDLNLMILNMVRRGVFGEPYYGECSYIHDLKDDDKNQTFFVTPDGEQTWRTRLMTEGHGSSYGPHGLTSVAKWMDINEGDRFDYCTAMMSDPRELHGQLVEQYGADSAPARFAVQTGDFVSTLIRTVKGRVIRLDYSITATRPYSRYYLLQGTQGCLDDRYGCYIRGDGPMHTWQPIDEYKKRYRHPWWTQDGDDASKVGGHGGMDYFCLREFVRLITDHHAPWVDCYDAAAYNAINHCSQLSIDRKGAGVEIPDFTKGRWKTPGWRRGPQDPMFGIV